MPQNEMRTFVIILGHVHHGAWFGKTKEEAFQSCRQWYGPKMPHDIELFTITEPPYPRSICKREENARR